MKIPRELRCKSNLAWAEARGGRTPSAVSDRRATKGQAKLAATPLAPGNFRTASRAAGFTLLEMMITLMIFLLLAGAVFGIMTGVLESTSTLQENQNHRDEAAALNAFLEKKLTGMDSTSTIVSYERGDGEGLVQNGVIFGNANLATAVDAKIQPNGYYTLRLTTLMAGIVNGAQQDARKLLDTAVTTDDPTLTWAPLITDIKTLDWQFLDFNATVWVDLWNSSANPNLVEFSMQPAGDLQPATMDFWLPQITAPPITAPPQSTAAPPRSTSP